MTIPVLSLTEAQALQALRSFLTAIVPAGTGVYRSEQNDVPEPQEANYILMTPLMQDRLETNETSCLDNIVTGSIAGTVLTVTAVTRGAVTPNQPVLDTSGLILPGTTVSSQLTGSPPWGVGTYRVNNTQTIAEEETLYIGTRNDLTGTKLTVQLDIDGPLSSDNIKVIETLFRSEYGSSAFTALGFDVQPLYCGEPRQAPFMNAEQQYEYRWSMDACMQINPVVQTPQQFADELAVTTVEVDASDPDTPPLPVGPDRVVSSGEALPIDAYEFFVDSNGSLVIRTPSGSLITLVQG
jgi:hypothetical protein